MSVSSKIQEAIADIPPRDEASIAVSVDRWVKAADENTEDPDYLPLAVSGWRRDGSSPEPGNKNWLYPRTEQLDGLPLVCGHAPTMAKGLGPIRARNPARNGRKKVKRNFACGSWASVCAGSLRSREPTECHVMPRLLGVSPHWQHIALDRE